MKIWESEPPGTLWATPGLLGDCFTFTYLHSKILLVPCCIPQRVSVM